MTLKYCSAKRGQNAMKKLLTEIAIVTLCLLSQIEPVAQTASPAKKLQGFLGTYHPFNGTAYGGEGWNEGELVQHAFNFGQNAVLVKGSHNGYTFEQNIDNSCREWDVNRVYGILLPPSEFGVVNQPTDSDILKPFEKKPGMIQGMHRFSELSKRCPQIAGVIIDDLYNDFPKNISLNDLREMKDALMGKQTDEEGKVVDSSPATTPDLKLYFVVYEHHLDIQPKPEVLELIDGVSFWMWKQSEHYKQFDDYINTLSRLYPNKEIISGVYVRHSRETPVVESVHHIIDRATDLYAKGKINGLLVFSAIWLSREESKRERWDALGLPQFLGRVYYPFLGEGEGRVVDSRTKKPLPNALVTISRLSDGKRLPVTRKFTDERGEYHFGGWTGKGKKDRVSYEIKIESRGSKPHIINVKLRAGAVLTLDEARL
jgi:hypothetical protein